MSVENPHPCVDEPGRASADRRGDRTDFWFTSAARGTAVVYVGLFVFLSVVIVQGDLAVDELSVGLLLRDIASAAFWSVLGVFGTSFYSIPLATLVVAASRGVLRRRRRRFDAPMAPTTGAGS